MGWPTSESTHLSIPTALEPAELRPRLERLVDRLQHYEARFERIEDSRAVFTRLYAGMTQRLAEALSTQQWDHPQWVVALALAFSERFFAAMDAFDAGVVSGAAWEQIQVAMRCRRTSVLQDLIGGMIGHIVHDLPLALVDVGLRDADGVARIADYHRVNDVLGRAIKPLKSDVETHFDPDLRWLDRVAGTTGTFLTDYGIRLSRAAAWYNAERLSDREASSDARSALETSPLALMRELFDPQSRLLRLVVRLVSVTISAGRRWPKPPVPTVTADASTPSQRYYFTTGIGRWSGEFRYSIIDWRAFRAARIGLKNRFLALGMALLMRVFRRASIESTISGYPDQGPGGVATNDVRIKLLGMTLYLLNEQYALAADGTHVFVRSYERFGPIAFLFNNEKKHPARVGEGGRHTLYIDMPLLGDVWQGDYRVTADGRHVESVLTCGWARATESISKVA